MKFMLLLFSIVVISMAKSIPGTVTLIHADPTFKTAVQEGRNLLVFPVIMNSHFISYPTYAELSDPLEDRHDRLKLTSYLKYQEKVADREQSERLNRIESDLIQERLLDIPTKLSYFDNTPFRFIQIFRVRKSFAINSKKQSGKHLTLEGEVWDLRKKGVVWRASATVESSTSKVSDREILLRCVELLYGSLPKFYFNSTERDW
jgi:hypothetical protein